MLRTLLVVTLSISLALAATAEAASVTLHPSKDNTLIQQTNPASQLSNGQGDIFVGRTNQDGQGPATLSIRRGLVQFDIAGSIPTGATITGVTLTMRDVMGLNGDPAVGLHRLWQDWGEGASFQNGGMGAAAKVNDATWLYTFYNEANPALSPTWNSPGGDFSPTASGSVLVTDDQGGGQLFTWSSAVSGNAQLIADVQSWLNNPAGNFGWLLQGDESRGQSAKRFNSGESTLPPNVPPALTITYVIPEPATWLLAATGLLFVAGRRMLRRWA